MHLSSSSSILASRDTLAILLAMSCMVLSGPDSASVSFGISEDFSPHTKHESREATWAGGQVSRWTGEQVDRWAGGQVDR